VAAATSTSSSYLLEHFYYGHLVKDGRPTEGLQLIGQSNGVRSEHIAECIQVAMMPPFRGAPEGTWAVLRGAQSPYVMVQSQLGTAGQFVAHFILLPSEVVRAYGGNLKALMRLLHKEAPRFESALVQTLGIPIDIPSPPNAEAQAGALLALMTAAHDRIQIIETLLAGIITGASVFVQGAPPELHQRIAFVEGLQTLLPPPARAGVTFTTHATPQRRPDATVSFYTDDVPPPNALVFRWGDPQPGSVQPTDDYARFIASQLRLDTTLVIQQTTALTPVAAWRIKRGDSLSEALRYASYRLKIDNSIRDNQPVEVDEAARVLAEDPTLSDDQRLMYAGHLLKLSLPLGQTRYLHQVAEVAQRNPDLELSLLRQMTDLLASGVNTGAVYDALIAWIGRPDGVTGMFWVELVQRAAIEHADALIRSRDAAALSTFIQRTSAAPAAAQIAVVLPQILEHALPLAQQDPALARLVFAQGARVFSGERFFRLCGDAQLLQQLPPLMARLQPHLIGMGKGGAPGLLAQATGEFGDDSRSILALRFAEIAVQNGNLALVDASAAAALAQAAEQPWAQQYDQTLRFIVRNLSTDVQIARLGEPGTRSLLQILLARRAYPEFAALLSAAGKALYADGDQVEFGGFVSQLFEETPLSASDIQAALKALPGAGLRPLPMMMAQYGALQQHQWDPALSAVTTDLNSLVLGNPRAAEQAPLALLLRIIQHQAQHKDSASAMRVAEMIPGMAAREGEAGTSTMLKVCYVMRENEQMRANAVELLRRYVRLLPEQADRTAVARLSSRLGGRVKRTLEATLLLKRLFDGVSLVEYAGFLHITAQFLHDTGLAYVERDRVPGLKILLGDLDSLNGGFKNDDRKALVREILTLGKLLVTLAQRQKNLRPRNGDAITAALLNGTQDAVGPLDLMLLLGGYFARGTRAPYNIEQSLQSHPLGPRAAGDLLAHAKISNTLLRAYLRLFPIDSKRHFSASALRGELESLWDDIPLHERRKLVHDLAVDFQRLPLLITHIAMHGSSRVLNDGDSLARRLESGQRRPESTLELYRFISGYFRKRVR
jgi:hypothetical protein